ncbi:hypothetical protein ACIB24_20960 [Spongisporangium articulatum]|uniref:WXG100 family type VII secretion target n=1 Tax=Spongisporangium articulatum TaxID=3362603 RepID=A0ABW8AT22_9ACTN
MAGFVGMVPEEVQSLGQLLAATVPGEIDGIISKITGQLGSTQWVGADRQQFETDWQGTYVAQLNQVKAALQEFGNHAMQEAQQQIDASAT